MNKAVVRELFVTAFLFISLFSCGKTEHDSRIVEPSSLLEIGMTEDEVIDMVEKMNNILFNVPSLCLIYVYSIKTTKWKH